MESKKISVKFKFLFLYLILLPIILFLVNINIFVKGNKMIYAYTYDSVTIKTVNCENPWSAKSNCIDPNTSSPITVYNLTITNQISKKPNDEDCALIIDVSQEGNNSVKGYFTINQQHSGYYDMVIYADAQTIYAPSDCSFLFSVIANDNESWVESIFADGISTIGSLNSVTFDNFSTENVTNMDYMFYCSGTFNELDISCFSTGNVTSMRGMFSMEEYSEEENLTKIIFGENFDTNNVTDISEMFLNCNLLTQLDLCNINVDNVTDISGMFNGCSSLKILDLSKFNTNKIEFFYGLFYDCTSLETLIIGTNTILKDNCAEDLTAIKEIYTKCSTAPAGLSTACDSWKDYTLVSASLPTPSAVDASNVKSTNGNMHHFVKSSESSNVFLIELESEVDLNSNDLYYIGANKKFAYRAGVDGLQYISLPTALNGETLVWRDEARSKVTGKTVMNKLKASLTGTVSTFPNTGVGVDIILPSAIILTLTISIVFVAMNNRKRKIIIK